MGTERSRNPIDEIKIRHLVEHYEGMYELLEILGYDTTYSIHKQFCERYNLIPDTKKRVNKSKSNKNILN